MFTFGTLVSRAPCLPSMVALALLAGAPFAQANAATEDGWFPFKPANDNGASVIGMADWLDKPAGRHGMTKIDGDHLSFADNTAAVFWGVNNCNQGCAPKKDEADRRAAFYAKYGVNAVRQHKFMQTICEPDDATTITAANWELFDYNFAALKKVGIYSGWSPIYYLQIKPGNKAALVAGEELSSKVGGNTMGLVNFAPDLQQLHIDLLVKLLKHKNPLTGLTYAEDPALAYLEIQNEDDIFWWSTDKQVLACPTYKKMFCKQFCDWLRIKYKDQAGLLAAWGPRALNAFKDHLDNESLDQDAIFPNCNPWFVGPDGMKMAKEQGTEQRLFDAFRFLADCQTKYYAKVTAAVRAAGYKGPLIGSPWQAAEGLSHYYNIYCDQQVGILDRHNYFGGGTPNGWQFAPTKFDNSSMLSHPGSGLLSSGLQLVTGHPFSLSEWDTQLPNDWLAEGAPIIAAYGMGLQGWSMSYQFASDGSGFSDAVDHRQPWGGSTLWNTDVPTKIGIYPALARMIYSGDIKRGPVISQRKLSLAELEQGKVGFAETVKQQGDVKSISGAVPPEAIAAGRVEITCTDKPSDTKEDKKADKKDDIKPLDMAAYTSGTIITSATKQLAWDTAGQGCFTIDAPGTKAVVGFAPKRAFTLGQATITIDNPFAVVFITSLERGKDIATAKSLLVTAVARARNTGMRFNAAGDTIEDIGKAPMLLEGVQATITIKRAGGAGAKTVKDGDQKKAATAPAATAPTVTVLDHDGRRTDATIPMIDGKFVIDGTHDHAIYYEITYP